MTINETQLQPPYYVVVFTSQRTGNDATGYAETSIQMMSFAAEQPGFLGVDSVKSAHGQGITCSYWRTTADIDAWKASAEHLLAQRRGRDTWYASYQHTRQG